MSATLSTAANPRLVRALVRGDVAEVYTALAGCTLLVAGFQNADGEAVVQTRRGAAGRRLVCAFTDLEALQAWDRNPPGSAVMLDAAEVGGLLPDAMVALNPAGPGGHLLEAGAFGGEPGSVTHDDPTLATNGRAQPDDGAPDLADPQQRRDLRRRANQFHELARRTAAAGDFASACEQLQPALSACSQLGDRLHGAAAELELAGWRARSGSTRLALSSWREAGATMAALGELDLALDALLDAAQAAADAGLDAEAEKLSIAALDLAAGSDFSDRLVGVWRTLTGDAAASSGAVGRVS